MKQKYSKKFDTSLILGDINFDDIRYTGHTQAVNNFLENERLCSAWDLFPVDFTFSMGTSFPVVTKGHYSDRGTVEPASRPA